MNGKFFRREQSERNRKIDETYETIGSPKTKFIKNYPPGPTSSAYNLNNETSNRIKKENKEIIKK